MNGRWHCCGLWRSAATCPGTPGRQCQGGGQTSCAGAGRGAGRHRCDGARRWVRAAELGQRTNPLPAFVLYCCALPLCFTGTRVFILRRNFECEHLILGTSAAVGNCPKEMQNASLSLQSCTVVILTQSVPRVALEMNSFQAGLQKSISWEENRSGKYRVDLSMCLKRIDEKCKILH